MELFRKIAEVIDEVGEKSHEAGDHVSSMAGIFATAGAGMIATAGGITAALFEMSEKASATGAQMEQLSQKTGIATDELSALGFAAKLHGGDIDTITTAMRGLSKGMSDLASANSPAKKALDDLGIATVDAAGHQRDMMSVLLDVSDAFKQMPDGAQKAADAQAIFTRGGLAMIPVLNEGRDAIQEQMEKARSLGIVYSDEAAKKSEEFEQSQVSLKAAMDGLWRSIAEQAMPTLQSWVEEITSVVSATREWVNAHPDLANGLLRLAEILAVGGTLLVGIATLQSAIPLLTSGFAAVVTPIGNVITAIGGLSGAVTALSTVSLVGLAAAIGYGIGQLANYALAVTGAQNSLDQFSTKIQAQVIYQGSMLETTQKAADVLKNQYGVAIDQGNMSIEQWNKAVTDALRAHQQLDPVLQESIGYEKEMAEGTHAAAQYWKEYFDQLNAGDPINKKLQTAIQNIVDALEGQKTQQLALAPAVDQAIKDGVSYDDIMSQLGTTIEEYVAKLESEGRTVPEVLQKLVDYDEEQQRNISLRNTYLTQATNVQNSLNDEYTSWGHVSDGIKQAAKDLQSWLDEGVPLTESQTLAKQKMDDLADSMKGVEAEAVANVAQWEDLTNGVNLGDTALGNLNDTQKQALQTIRDMNQATRDADEYHQKLSDDWAKETEQAFALKQAVEELKNDFGKAFDDMFQKSKSFFSSLEDVAQTVGLGIVRNMFSSFMAELFAPLEAKWTDFLDNTLMPKIKSFASQITDAISGAFKSAFSGLSSAFSGLSDMLGGGVLGDIGAGGIFGGIIAGATALFNAFIGTAHQKADEFTKQFQDPFDQAIAKIADANAQLLQSGQATVDSVTQARNDVSQLWTEFQNEAQQFGQKGGDYLKVATQGLETETPKINAILQSMGVNIQDLSQTAADAVSAAEQKILDAAQKQLDSVESELAGVHSQLLDSLNSKVAAIDSEISKSQSTIAGWQDQIKGLNLDIQAQTDHLNDATFWTNRYNDLIKASSDALEAATAKRQSLEQQIADLTYQTEVDRLNAIIHTSQSQQAISAAQDQLNALEAQRSADEAAARVVQLGQLKTELASTIEVQSQAAAAYAAAQTAAANQVAQEKQNVQQSIDSDKQQVAQLQSNIAAMTNYINSLTTQNNATIAIIQSMGGEVTARMTEMEKIDGTIASLLARGSSLEAERSSLTSLLGVAAQTPDVMNSASSAFNSTVNGISSATNTLSTALQSVGSSATSAAQTATIAAQTIAAASVAPISYIQALQTASQAATSGVPAAQTAFAALNAVGGAHVTTPVIRDTSGGVGTTPTAIDTSPSSGVNGGTNGILMPNGQYMTAQQIYDLQNSGGSYTTSSGYNKVITNAVAGTDLGTAVYYSPGSVASMTPSQLSTAGISPSAAAAAIPSTPVILQGIDSDGNSYRYYITGSSTVGPIQQALGSGKSYAQAIYLYDLLQSSSGLLSASAVASMTDSQRTAYGITSYQRGGPTKEGLSYLHDEEFVVPKGGTLVKSGGPQIIINLSPTFNTPDPKGARDMFMRYLPQLNDAIQANVRGEGDRTRSILGVK